MEKKRNLLRFHDFNSWWQSLIQFLRDLRRSDFSLALHIHNL